MKVFAVRYPCSQCKYKATERGSLRRHVKIKHTTHISNLKTRVESVHEEVQYAGSECEYKATEKGNLKRHAMKKHKQI